jgi:hypothetical protein
VLGAQLVASSVGSKKAEDGVEFDDEVLLKPPHNLPATRRALQECPSRSRNVNASLFMPKHQGRERISRHQQARRANNIANPGNPQVKNVSQAGQPIA